MNTASKQSPEVFQVSFSVERQWARELVRAVLGAILFQRVLGNLRPRTYEVCGVTFPVPADAALDEEITAKVDAFCRALLDNAATTKPCRLVVALYPTPLSPRQLRPPQPKPRPLAPTVTSALGWFSASAKALATGAEEEVEEDEPDLGRVWEAWVVEVDVAPEGRRGVGEDRLRSQLNDFLLRSTSFVMEKTAHVPPITTADLQPFGVQILVNPSKLSFAVPKAIISAPALPLLHKQLVAQPRAGSTPEGRRDSYATR